MRIKRKKKDYDNGLGLLSHPLISRPQPSFSLSFSKGTESIIMRELRNQFLQSPREMNPTKKRCFQRSFYPEVSRRLCPDKFLVEKLDPIHYYVDA